VASVAEVAALGVAAWWSLPSRPFVRARFDGRLLGALWRFSGQLTVITILSTVLKQLDKLLLSRLVPLDQLGYYVAAASLSSGLLLFATPISTALFPRFSALLANGQHADARAAYERSIRLVAALAAPVAAALALFAPHILQLWTRSAPLAAAAGPVLTVLACAMFLNALMQVPYALQIAAGRPVIALWTNGLGVLLLAPLTTILIIRHGIAGAGIAWLIFNVIYAGVVSVVIEHRALDASARLALWRTAAPPALTALAWFGAARLLGNVYPAAWIALASAATLGYALTVVRLGMTSRRQGAALRPFPATLL
jgi:O-antigen/teichoic acid export membrane protein